MHNRPSGTFDVLNKISDFQIPVGTAVKGLREISCDHAQIPDQRNALATVAPLTSAALQKLMTQQPSLQQGVVAEIYKGHMDVAGAQQPIGGIPPVAYVNEGPATRPPKVEFLTPFNMKPNGPV